MATIKSCVLSSTWLVTVLTIMSFNDADATMFRNPTASTLQNHPICGVRGGGGERRGDQDAMKYVRRSPYYKAMQNDALLAFLYEGQLMRNSRDILRTGNQEFARRTVCNTVIPKIDAQHNNAGTKRATNGAGKWETMPRDIAVSTEGEDPAGEEKNRRMQVNARFISGLLDNLEIALDKWMINASTPTRHAAHNIWTQIQRESMQDELRDRATRAMRRAGMSLDEPPPLQSRRGTSVLTSRTPLSSPPVVNIINTNIEERKQEAQRRRKWEAQFRKSESDNDDGYVGEDAAIGIDHPSPSSRINSVKANANSYMSDLDSAFAVARFADEKKNLEGAMTGSGNGSKSPPLTEGKSTGAKVDHVDGGNVAMEIAASKTSQLVAQAGAEGAFEGGRLGIGGLDDVLNQIKRRIWVPLAAPPSLLRELGINPVRGLLLYGMPGCGKSLLARTLGQIFSPARPITTVSGPEIMDKFVGSSEANLREIFDNPPDIHQHYKDDSNDDGATLSRVALHVIVLDEFDAMARARGGRDGKGDQGDAGVARDSVVNQLLAKMDGVDDLAVPTLVIGLTNRRTLLEPALLRPGRFEVQIEVPPPRTVEQRVAILKVHTENMYNAGRLFVADAAQGTIAWRRVQKQGLNDLTTYSELLKKISEQSDGMSGASLAGVCRAAASRALERAVYDFAGESATQKTEGVVNEGMTINDCLVTAVDFFNAIEDVLESGREGDGGEDNNLNSNDVQNSTDRNGEKSAEANDKQ